MDLKDYEDVGFADYAIPSFNRFAWAGRYFHDILFLFRFSFIPLQPESKSCFLRGAAVVAAAEIIPMNLIRVMPA